ncbi:MAG: hypothetical protein AAB539_02750 [Patescibacteria group bacterium]
MRKHIDNKNRTPWQKAVIYVLIGLIVATPFLTAVSVAQAQSSPEDELGFGEISPEEAQRLAAERLRILESGGTLEPISLSNENIGAGTDKPEAEEGCNLISSLGLLCAIALVLKAGKAITLWLLGFAAGILDAAFDFNTRLTPLNNAAVVIGWEKLRNFTNSFLIIILLWVALTIIFGIERFGGQKLLFRVIIVALFLNFSLILVSGLFSFTNIISKSFVQPLGGQKISAFLEQTFKTRALLKETNTAQELAATTAFLEETGRRCSTAAHASLEVTQIKESRTFLQRLRDGILFGGVSPEIRDAAQAPFEECLAATPGLNEAMNAHDNIQNNIYNQHLNMIVSNASAIVIGGFVIFLFIYMAAFLFVRIAMMILLAILAPLAFLAYMTPSNYVQKYFHEWADNLIKWALFAPLLYLFVYLILLVMSIRTLLYTNLQIRAGAANIAIPFDTDRIIFSFVIIVMLIAAIHVAKAAGGKMAASLISITKGIALGAVGAVGAGVAVGAMGVTGATAASSPKMASFLQGMSKIPGVGRFVGKGTVERTKQRIKATYSKLKETTSGQIVTDYRSAAAADKVAMAQTLAERGDLKLLGDIKTQLQALTTAERYGEHQNILKNAPYLVQQRHVTGAQSDQEAKKFYFGQYDDKKKLDSILFKKDAAGNFADKESVNARLSGISENDLQRLAKNQRTEYKNLMDYFYTTMAQDRDNFRQMLGARTQMIEDFSQTTIGRSLYNPPPPQNP